MSDVIRPDFSARRRADAEKPASDAGQQSRPPSGRDPRQDSRQEYRPLRVFGRGAGYTVALVEDEDARAGSVLKVVVGPDSEIEVEAVAILPATPEGDADAEVVAMAILRTLEMIEAAGNAPEIA